MSDPPGLRDGVNAVDVTEFHQPQTYRRYRLYFQLWRLRIRLWTIKVPIR